MFECVGVKVIWQHCYVYIGAVCLFSQSVGVTPILKELLKRFLPKNLFFQSFAEISEIFRVLLRRSKKTRKSDQHGAENSCRTK